MGPEFQDWEEAIQSLGDFELDFDFLWEGPVPSDQGNDNGVLRVPHKQALRQSFHRQINILLGISGVGLRFPRIQYAIEGRMKGGELVPLQGAVPEVYGPPGYRTNPLCYIKLGGQRYMPLLTRRSGLICHLDVVILSDPTVAPGNRRDTDNRLKLLRDALRIPQSEDEVRGSENVTPDPCICLLEDDGTDLLGEVTSHTRPLLRTPLPGRDHEVVVWIRGRIVKRGEGGF